MTDSNSSTVFTALEMVFSTFCASSFGSSSFGSSSFGSSSFGSAAGISDGISSTITFSGATSISSCFIFFALPLGFFCGLVSFYNIYIDFNFK